MARSVGGITGRMSGKLGGVQLFTTRRGTGKVTGVRLDYHPPRELTTAQRLQTYKMQDARSFFDYTFATWILYFKQRTHHPQNWFADWFTTFRPLMVGTPHMSTLESAVTSISSYGTIPRTQIKLTRVSTTSLKLQWSTVAIFSGQASTDRLMLLLIRANLPFSRTTANYRYLTNPASRASGSYTMTSLTSSAPYVAIVYFYPPIANDFRREPLQILPITT